MHKADGSLYVAPVWPGPSVFPDFTRASTRTWWAGLYKDFIDDGFAGFWNDMNEPAVFETPTKTMPLDNVHRIESDDFAPRNASHAEIHNVFGMENTRATFEGMLRWRPGQRPFVMTRASFAGGQRYAVTWTGDNSSTWDHLRLSVEQLINLGLSGFAYSGADVGGFTGGPSPELLTRWFEVAAFTPIFRDHSTKGAPRAEPWVDGPEQLAIRRRYVEERYRLLPYIYALAEQNSRTGDPLMRPVFYDYPEAIGDECDRSMSFTLGPSLLIAGPPKPESPAPFDICLPKGGWYDYWTECSPSRRAKTLRRVPAGSTRCQCLSARGRSSRASRWCRAQWKGRRARSASISILVPAAAGSSISTTDRASTVRAFARRVDCAATSSRGLVLRFGPREGSWHPWWKQIQVIVHGPKATRATIKD